MRLVRFTEKNTNNIVVEFPYRRDNPDDVVMKDELKSLNLGVQFNNLASEPFKWTASSKVLHDPEAYERLVKYANKYSFEISFEIEEYLKKFHKEFYEKLELSKQNDSNTFEVDGLKLPLRGYQKSAAAYLLATKRGMLAFSMRLGKSLTSLAVIQKTNSYPCLIVAPANLKLNWKAEILKVFENVSESDITILKGRKSAEDQHADNKFVIVNYDILNFRLDELKKVKYKGIIADEFHYCGSPDSSRTKSLKALAKSVPYVIGLTGTPVQNHTKEMASLLDALGYIKYFGGKTAFLNRYCDVSYNGFGYTITNIKDPARALRLLPELNEKLSGICMLRKTREDVFNEIPLIEDVVVNVEIDSPSYKASYKLLKNNIPTKENIFKLKQEIGLAKIDIAEDWINNWLEQETGKLVVFAHHQAVQHALVDKFPNCARIVEGLTPEQKHKQQLDFQNDPGTRLIICSMTIAGEGLQLDAADTVLFVEFGWNPKKMAQAAARIENVIKLNPLTRYYLKASETIDDILYDLLNDKEANSDAIVDRTLSMLMEKLRLKNGKNY